MNETTEQTGMLTRVERSGGEIAVSAMAAKAKAEVEARYVIALQRPRNIMDARKTILDSCQRPQFAAGARYKKPVGAGRSVTGFSIRFAEEAIKAMKNILTDSMIIWEDEQKRCVRVTVTDLESNTTYSDDVVINKTVERRALKEGQSAISERMNSTGEKVFLVAATEDDLANKINAAKSKIIRNNGLRLVPQDILEEALAMISETIAKGGSDVKAETKKVCDAFGNIGVRPSDLERYLKHSIDSVSPSELEDLRGIYSAIRDGDTTWGEVLENLEPKTPTASGPKVATAEAAASVIDAKVVEKPYEAIAELCKKDGVTEAQVLQFAKKRKLAKDELVELVQVSDNSLRTILSTWTSVLPKIKSEKAE